MYYQKQIRIGSISTSEKEIKDILKAWIVISAAFAILLSDSIFSSDFYAKFIISSLTVGIGFLLHELGHKFVAQRYGCFAEFRSFDNMLILALVMSFFGFILAAPGAVMISGRVDKARNGKISAAGPIVNLVLAIIFLALAFLQLPNLFKDIAFYGFMINSWLALFNMIPFWLFDGAKIIRWNKMIYGSIVAVAFLFMLLQGFVPMA
ncbi:site-2 protease family protein [Candidatus Woesearchaeota archaeon]|nr:site-2 protease family protein [Candidatus Woesearchaeota archaeon]|tara:strand:+ start:2290 stop:2910 length:621 start_codon:yes stop_codon:yes gene_type:complete